MSNHLNDIADYLDKKLNKKAEVQKKQDKLVFALEHLDAAANMLAEEGNHLMSQAVTELMDRAVKKAEEEKHLPEGSKKKLEVAKYLTELLLETTLDADKELTTKVRDRRFLEDLGDSLQQNSNEFEEPVGHAYKEVVKDQTKLRNMHDDLLQLDQELGSWQHHSELDGVVEFLLSITFDMLLLYGGGRYGISTKAFNELKKPFNIYKTEQSSASNDASRDDIIDASIDVIYNDIMGNVVENEPEVGDMERFKEHEHLHTDYRNRMEEALDQEHRLSMPDDIQHRDEMGYSQEEWKNEKWEEGWMEDELSPNELNPYEAKQLKDMW